MFVFTSYLARACFLYSGIQRSFLSCYQREEMKTSIFGVEIEPTTVIFLITCTLMPHNFSFKILTNKYLQQFPYSNYNQDDLVSIRTLLRDYEKIDPLCEDKTYFSFIRGNRRRSFSQLLRFNKYLSFVWLVCIEPFFLLVLFNLMIWLAVGLILDRVLYCFNKFYYLYRVPPLENEGIVNNGVSETLDTLCLYMPDKLYK